MDNSVASTSGAAQVSLRGVVARVAPVTIATQALSFFSSIALATYLGASYETDAYYLALAVPALAYGVVLAGIRMGAIPALTEQKDRGSDSSFSAACSELMTAVVLASSVLALMVATVALVALPLLTTGSDAATLSLARSLVLVLAPFTVLGAVVGGLGAILTVRQNFVAPVAVLACEPLAKIALLVSLSSSLGAYALALGNVIGGCAAVTILWILLKRSGLRLRVRLPHESPFLRSILRVSLPLLVANVVLLANPVIDRLMAIPLQPGSITVLELGNRMFGVSLMLLATSLVAPITATWAARFTESGWTALRDSAFHAIRLSLYILLPVVSICLVLSQEIISFAYLGGQFGPDDAARTADVFACFMLGLPATVLVVIFASIFIVQQDAWVPMFIAFGNVILNLVMNLILREWLGIAGIALSTTVSATFFCLIYARAIHHRYGGLSLIRLLPLAFRLTIAAAVAASAALLVTTLFGAPTSRASAFVTSTAAGSIGALAYIASLAIAGELPMFASIFDRRRQKDHTSYNGTDNATTSSEEHNSL